MSNCIPQVSFIMLAVVIENDILLSVVDTQYDVVLLCVDNHLLQAEDMRCPPFVRKIRQSEDPMHRVTKYCLSFSLIFCPFNCRGHY
jgi:hypothetical protein